MNWSIENPLSKERRAVAGTLDEVLAAAEAECCESGGRRNVWLLPVEVCIVQVTAAGSTTAFKLSGPDFVRLMRRHRTTIAGLAHRLGVTQRRVRFARKHGFANAEVFRDWFEAITCEDIGPLPDHYRIRRYWEEASCAWCDAPLLLGDTAFEYVGEVFCSIHCCRRQRGWTP